MTTIEQALRELIACNELKERLEAMPYGDNGSLAYQQHWDEHESREPIAWANARAALAAHEAQEPYGWVPMYREGEESARIFFKKPTGDLLDCCRPVYTRGTK